MIDRCFLFLKDIKKVESNTEMVQTNAKVTIFPRLRNYFKVGEGPYRCHWGSRKEPEMSVYNEVVGVVITLCDRPIYIVSCVCGSMYDKMNGKWSTMFH